MYMQHAIEMFSRAIENDSRYARAFAGKADCHSYLYWYFGGSKADLEQAAVDSENDLKLDNMLAEAHAARGLAVSLSNRNDGQDFSPGEMDSFSGECMSFHSPVFKRIVIFPSLVFS